MESNDLDKLFQNAFEQAEETPSNSVWLGIEQKLAKQEKTHVVPFYKKYRTAISIAATFLLFFGLGLTFYKYKSFSTTEKIEDMIADVENNSSKSTSKSPISDTKKETDFEIEKQHNTTSKGSMLAAKPNIQKQIELKEENNSNSTLETASNGKAIEKIEIAEPDQMLASVEVEFQNPVNIEESVKYLDPIQDEAQASFAYSAQKQEVKSSLVTRVLNGITKNIITKTVDIEDKREIEFRNDDEGSLSINILNSFARK